MDQSAVEAVFQRRHGGGDPLLPDQRVPVIGKVVHQRGAIDWRRFYVHRLFRLAPLYLCTIAAMVVIVALISGGKQSESAFVIFQEIVVWTTFTIFGQPEIDAIPTFALTSGVTWSLTFEWFFYCLLPVVAVAMRRRTSLTALGMSIVMLLVIGANLDDPRRLIGFAGAPVAVYAVQFDGVRRFARTRAASCLVILMLGLATVGFDYSYQRAPLLLLSAAFVLIACGSDILGLLTCRWALYLGRLGYGIYLLHGLLLFVLFTLIFPTASGWSSDAYWLVAVAATPVLIVAAALAFEWIETPGMAHGNAVERWLSMHAGRRRAATVARPHDGVRDAGLMRRLRGIRPDWDRGPT